MILASCGAKDAPRPRLANDIDLAAAGTPQQPRAPLRSCPVYSMGVAMEGLWGVW
jgi:hypothetical protein